MVGMILTATINAAPIPALGAMPTCSNMGENLEAVSDENNAG